MIVEVINFTVNITFTIFNKTNLTFCNFRLSDAATHRGVIGWLFNKQDLLVLYFIFVLLLKLRKKWLLLIQTYL
jgi:hypothetical protein